MTFGGFSDEGKDSAMVKEKNISFSGVFMPRPSPASIMKKGRGWSCHGSYAWERATVNLHIIVPK